MQTNFSLAQLAQADIREADAILRTCVHCGFCTATCPTYVLLGDELDSPRGRIYLIKDMLEQDAPASPQVAKHLDRCLSCLSCMTTCPSGVDYMHLVDMARVRVERSYKRPAQERLQRRFLAAVLPRPRLFRLALSGAGLAKPFARALPKRLRPMLAQAPRRRLRPSPVDRPQVFSAQGPRRMRVALLSGCAQQVVAPEINEATIRLLTRHGAEVVIAEGAGCCGALTHHMGDAEGARRFAAADIRAWARVAEEGGLDAVVVNASGCGTMLKDYGHLFKGDPELAGPAARIATLAKDVSEILTELGLTPSTVQTGQAIAYHAPCSLQHGQKIRSEPAALLRAAGFDVRLAPEGHLCCGSAGVYNLLQPELAIQLRDCKARNLESVAPQAIASGNAGCILQIASGTDVPVVHAVELLDWATGGPLPEALKGRPGFDGAAAPSATRELEEAPTAS